MVLHLSYSLLHCSHHACINSPVKLSTTALGLQRAAAWENHLVLTIAVTLNLWLSASWAPKAAWQLHNLLIGSPPYSSGALSLLILWVLYFGRKTSQRKEKSQDGSPPSKTCSQAGVYSHGWHSFMDRTNGVPPALFSQWLCSITYSALPFPNIISPSGATSILKPLAFQNNIPWILPGAAAFFSPCTPMLAKLPSREVCRHSLHLLSTPQFTTIWLNHSTEITLMDVTNSLLPCYYIQWGSCGPHFSSLWHRTPLTTSLLPFLSLIFKPLSSLGSLTFLVISSHFPFIGSLLLPIFKVWVFHFDPRTSSLSSLNNRLAKLMNAIYYCD